MKNASFDASIGQIRNLLDSCDFALALKSAQLLEGTDTRELRIIGHLVGKISYRQGNYQAALQHFQTTEAAYGEYIGVTCDIASAHYMLENFEAFEIEAKRAIATLKKIRSHLSQESMIRSSLSLSKFSEELGMINAAVDICEEALASPSDHSTGALESVRLMLQAQLLRLHSQFNSPLERLRKHYRSLLQLSKNKARLFQHVDVQHALILAELRLLSPEQALSRLKSLMKSAKLIDVQTPAPEAEIKDTSTSVPGEMNEADLRLCYFDLMAEGLLVTSKVWSSFPEADFQHLTRFEETVSAIQFKRASREIKPDGKLTLAQRLTLLALDSQFSANVSSSLNAESAVSSAAKSMQLELLLSTLSNEDQKLWQNRLFPINEKLNFIYYDSANGRLTYGASSLALNGTTLRIIFEKLLEAKTDGGVLSTSDLAQAIWDESYTISHYERLRVSTRRLNSALQKITGTQENLIFTKATVQLKSELNFKRD